MIPEQQRGRKKMYCSLLRFLPVKSNAPEAGVGASAKDKFAKAMLNAIHPSAARLGFATRSARVCNPDMARAHQSGYLCPTLPVRASHFNFPLTKMDFHVFPHLHSFPSNKCPAICVCVLNQTCKRIPLCPYPQVAERNLGSTVPYHPGIETPRPPLWTYFAHYNRLLYNGC